MDNDLTPEEVQAEVRYLTRVLETAQAGSLTHSVAKIRLEELQAQCKVPQ